MRKRVPAFTGWASPRQPPRGDLDPRPIHLDPCTWGHFLKPGGQGAGVVQREVVGSAVNHRLGETWRRLGHCGGGGVVRIGGSARRFFFRYGPRAGYLPKEIDMGPRSRCGPVRHLGQPWVADCPSASTEKQ